MIQELVITPTELVNTVMTLDYYNKDINKQIIVTNRNDVHTNRDYVKDDIMVIRFDETRKNFVFRWDDQDDRMSQVALAISQYPYLNHPGNRNYSGRPHFLMVNKMQNAYDNVLKNKQKGLIFNLINNTTVGRMKDISYAVGFNPTGMDPTEIFNKLIDFQTGILMNGDLAKNISLIESDSNQVFIVMKKAMLLGIITQRDGIFYIKTEPVGDSEDKVLNYLKENKSLYESYVRKEVVVKDKISQSDMLEKVLDIHIKRQVDTKVKPKHKTIEGYQEVSDLMEKAKFYSIKTYQNMSEEGLKEAIAIVEEANPKIKEEFEAMMAKA